MSHMFGLICMVIINCILYLAFIYAVDKKKVFKPKQQYGLALHYRINGASEPYRMEIRVKNLADAQCIVNGLNLYCVSGVHIRDGGRVMYRLNDKGLIVPNYTKSV